MISIRRMVSEDRACIEGILRSDSSFVEDEIMVALELVDDALTHESSDYWIRLALLEEQVVGYICFGPTPMTASTFDLYWVVCHVDHRGKGVARTLITEMEAELQERNQDRVQVRVETSETDGYEAARRLYAGLGYPETARFKDFYEKGDDLIVYYKCF